MASPNISKNLPGPSTATKSQTQHEQGQPLTVDDSDDEEEEETYQHKAHPKKYQKDRNKLKAKPTVIESSDDDDQISSKKKKIDTLDSDIEEVENPKETSEEELGELSYSILMIFKSLTHDVLKSGWPTIGHPQYMDFSNHVPV